MENYSAVYILSVCLLAVVAIEAVIQLMYVRIVLPMFETKPPFNVPEAQPDDRAERISFPSTNNVTIRGSLYMPESQFPRGLVLFCPELDGNHWSAMSYTEGLYDAGFAVLSFDFRGQGESDAMPGYKPLHWMTNYELSDAEAALKFIESRADLQNLPLVTVGVSRGSTAALVLAARFMHVQAVCCEGAYSTSALMNYFVLRWACLYLPEWALKLCPQWHFALTLRITRAVSQWRRGCQYVMLEHWLKQLRGCPILLVAGERDNYVHPDIGQGIINQIPSSNGQVWLVPKAKHNRARVVNPAVYDRRLAEFFSAVALPTKPVSAGEMAVV